MIGRRAVLAVGVLAAVAIHASPARAQAVPIPAPSFGPHTYSTITYFVNDYPEMVRVTSRFEKVGFGGEVDVEFRFKTAGAAAGASTFSYATDFAPTFFVRRSGLGDRVFYAGGWSHERGATVVERWTFDEVDVGASVPESGGRAVSTIDVAPPRRERIAVLESRVVIAAACNAYGADDTLYLLERVVGGRRVIELDASSGESVDLCASGAGDDWGTHDGIYGGATSPGGFVVLTDRNAVWNTFQHLSDSYDVVLIVDTDLDGQPTSIGVENDGDVLEDYDGTWVKYHSVP